MAFPLYPSNTCEFNPNCKYLNSSDRLRKVEGISVRETFRTFLQELDDPLSGKALLEAEVLRVMRREGFSDVQVFEMPLEKLLDLFYDAYLLKASRILAKASKEAFLKKLQSILS